jgi:hypothetical protein
MGNHDPYSDRSGFEIVRTQVKLVGHDLVDRGQSVGALNPLQLGERTPGKASQLWYTVTRSGPL